MYLYRYTDWVDEPMLSVFVVIKETPCGYWFDFYGDRRWTSNKSKSRYAYDTKAKALFNYIKRKEKQIAILQCRIEDAQEMLKIAKKLDPDKKMYLPLPKSNVLEDLV